MVLLFVTWNMFTWGCLLSSYMTGIQSLLLLAESLTKNISTGTTRIQSLLQQNPWQNTSMCMTGIQSLLQQNPWQNTSMGMTGPVIVSGVTYSRVLDKDFLVADKQCLQRFDDSSQVLVILVVVVHVHGIQHIMHGHHPVLKTTATPQCKLFVPCYHPEVNSNTST